MTEFGEGVAASRKKKARMSFDPADHKASTPKILQIYLYSAKDMPSYIWVFHVYAVTARSMLVQHKLDLRMYPGLPTVKGENDLIIDWTAKIETRDHQEQVISLSQKLKEAPKDALPVIFCKVTDAVGDNAETVEYNGRPFVLIYGNHISADKVTLLHEIGHAADCRFHPPWGLGRPDKLYDFMATPGDLPAGSKELAQTQDRAYYRNTIFKPDVVSLEKAKFAVAPEKCKYPTF